VEISEIPKKRPLEVGWIEVELRCDLCDDPSGYVRMKEIDAEQLNPEDFCIHNRPKPS